jgi:altronate dehydratase small subunit
MAGHPRLLMLDAGDNIAVATADLTAGEIVILDGLVLTLERATATGHKVAVRPIAQGEKIVKYRVPIGSATQAIAPGQYVHTHNLKSDYIATYTLDAARDSMKTEAT